MPGTIRVKPRDGVSVRRVENGTKIPLQGADVPDNSYYQRRIADGDLIKIKPSKTVATKKTTDEKSKAKETE